MINEIKKPLPTIEEFLKQKQSKKIESKKSETILNDEDVAFNRDPSIIEELAKKSNISYELAETILIAFFEEIKKNLYDGKIIIITGLGKFYLNGPTRNKYYKFVLPTSEKCSFLPKFKLYYNVRLTNRKNFK